jgi:hypothetical protein
MAHLCKCQDMTGAVCNRKMSKVEYDQDGMCSFCADSVWEEITTGKQFTHRRRTNAHNPSSPQVGQNQL